MPTLTLTEAQQLALRALLTIEPTPGCPMTSPEVLRLIEKLVPCDAMGVGGVGNDGCLLEEVSRPCWRPCRTDRRPTRAPRSARLPLTR